MPTKKQQYPKSEEEEKVVSDTVEETGSDTVCGIERKPPKYHVIRCDATTLEKSLNSIKDIHSIWQILVEPSYNGAFFDIIYLDFDDED